VLTNNLEEREEKIIHFCLPVCMYLCMYVCMDGCRNGGRDMLCMMFGCKHRMGMAVNHALLSCVVLEYVKMRKVMEREGRRKKESGE